MTLQLKNKPLFAMHHLVLPGCVQQVILSTNYFNIALHQNNISDTNDFPVQSKQTCLFFSDFQVHTNKYYQLILDLTSDNVISSEGTLCLIGETSVYCAIINYTIICIDVIHI